MHGSREYNWIIMTIDTAAVSTVNYSFLHTRRPCPVPSVTCCIHRALEGGVQCLMSMCQNHQCPMSIIQKCQCPFFTKYSVNVDLYRIPVSIF